MTRFVTASRRNRGQRGQATVELALLLPVLALLLLLAVQVALVARDRVVAVHTVRVAARAAIVDPDEAAVRDAVRAQGGPVDRVRVEVTDDPHHDDLVAVTVRMRPVTVPIVGRVLGHTVLTERLSVLVEGRAPPA